MITLSGIKRFFDAIDSGHTWKCVVEGSEIEDVKKDRESSVIIEGYDFSEKAVYFEGRYLPQPAFHHPYPGRRVRHRPSGF